MKYTQHPLSAENLSRCAWQGRARRATAREVTVRTFLSAKHPGFVHYEVCDLEVWTRAWSKQPASPEFVVGALAHEVQGVGLELDDFKWRESVHDAHDWDNFKRIVTEGEFVYFIQAGPFVKIGKTSGRPDARVSELQTGCPYDLNLLAHISGGIKRERQLHARFHHLHVRGEWFKYERELYRFIKELA